jgi:hypothetical protein
MLPSRKRLTHWLYPSLQFHNWSYLPLGYLEMETWIFHGLVDHHVRQ